jgi:rfaE bifunctional protein nucleotidyltransferase chain/domain
METPKLVTRDRMVSISEQLKSRGRTLVFTNGCFDILHAGHVSYLEAAAREGDLLVVGLNSDLSVRAIKGPLRPVVAQEHRARVLAGLACVGHVVFFDEPDPGTLIRALRPDVLVKGADWDEAAIIGADFVKASGGRVVRISMEPGISTTLIIQRILRTHA